ncbi:MAG: hypothetical protein P8013_11710 [Candidatus Sulfobium sp.]|jgi:hypothetical protein
MASIRVYIISVILVFLALAAAAAAANAAGTREIELVDGSVIIGEVVSLSGGIYTVRSATLGTLRIKESDIQVIRMKNSTVRDDVREQERALQNSMPDGAEIQAFMNALQNDPDLQKLVQDPEIMKAVQAGDIGALMSSPEFTKLLEKYRSQDINKNPSR